MTSRTRFLNTLSYGTVDRAPLWEEGIREDVREAWARQGLAADDDLRGHFRFDHRAEAPIDIGPRPDFEGASLDPECFIRLRDHYQAGPSRLPDDWHVRIRTWARRDYPLGMTVWRGLFRTLGVGNWRTLEPVLLALRDYPSVVTRTLRVAMTCAERTIEQALSGVMLDYAVFDEPIASPHGALISPSDFRRFCGVTYRRLIDFLQMRGVQWFVARSYGNPTVLLPEWIDAGINVFWCNESVRAGVDYVRLRKEYGRHLRLIGGIDHLAIREGPEAIDLACGAVVPRLLEDGGYLPLADGRIRSYIPWKHYAYYRRRLEEMAARYAHGGERS